MTDILQVFEREGIEMRRAGAEYVCRCPIHNEKTPSCYINPEKGLWNCHGCHQGGDAIRFIMLYKGIDFKAAKRYLGVWDENTPDAILARQKAQKKAEFRAWCEAEYNRLFNDLLEAAEGTRWFNSLEAMPDYMIELIRQDSVREHHMDILLSNNEQLKYELYKARRV